MWFRVALLLILWLLLFKFLNGLFRAINARRRNASEGGAGHPRPRHSGSDPAEKPRTWTSADVIDVPYADVEDSPGPESRDQEKRRSS